jgi:hypothetical protein
MKLFAHYDATGAIRSIVTVNAPSQFHAMLTPKPGLSVAEVEGTEIKANATVEELRKIGKEKRVATPNRVRLTTKS